MTNDSDVQRSDTGPVAGLASPGLVRALALALLLGLAAPSPAEVVNGTGVSAANAASVLRRHPLRLMSGGTLSLAALRGEVVVLNFWASWCGPCRRELPQLAVLNAEWLGQGGRVLAISIDEERGNVERFARRENMRLPVVLDGPNGLARELDLRAVPLTIVLNRNGEVAFASTRSDAAGVQELAVATRRLLAERPVAASEPAGGSR